MHEELIKRLREGAISADSGNEISESLYSDIMQAADAIEELIVVVRAQKAVLDKFQNQKWNPVTDRLRLQSLEPMKPVLLVIRRMGEDYCHDPFISTGHVSINKVSWWCSHDGDCTNNGVKVTHWMPLPELPKEE